MADLSAVQLDVA
jgi:hypothetical protein